MIASQPHLTGSPEAAGVRADLAIELRALGLAVRTQAGVLLTSDQRADP